MPWLRLSEFEVAGYIADVDAHGLEPNQVSYVKNAHVVDGCLERYPGYATPILPLVFTSHTYPVHVRDDLTASTDWISGFQWMPPDDGLDTTCDLVSGSMAVTAAYSTYGNFGAVAWDSVFDYDNSREAEWLEATCTLAHGSFYASATFSTYSNYIESLDASCALASGSMAVTAGYVSYANYQPEELQATCALVSGSLT